MMRGAGYHGPLPTSLRAAGGKHAWLVPRLRPPPPPRALRVSRPHSVSTARARARRWLVSSTGSDEQEAALTTPHTPTAIFLFEKLVMMRGAGYHGPLPTLRHAAGGKHAYVVRL